MINNQIYITSIYNAVEAAKRSGKIDLKTLQLFNLYRYYINFTDSIIATGDTTFNDWNILLKKEVAKFRSKYSREICNYKIVVTDSPGNTTSVITNTAPTLDNNTINIGTEDDYQFVVGDFLVNFSDSENNKWKHLLVYPIVSSDTILKTGPTGTVNVLSPLIIDIEGLELTDTINLFLKRTTTDSFGVDNFTFRVSDDAVDYLYSALKTMGMSGATTVTNEPATVGDNTVYASNRAVTVLTLAMFTTGLTPPYNDPEGDLIDAIRVDEISTANIGVFKYNGVPVLEGAIITREDINLGLFTHEAPDQDDINSDVINFSARDEGSGIWVQ